MGREKNLSPAGLLHNWPEYPGLSQEPAAPLGSPMWVQELKDLDHLLLYSQVINRELDCKGEQEGLEPMLI